MATRSRTAWVAGAVLSLCATALLGEALARSYSSSSTRRHSTVTSRPNTHVHTHATRTHAPIVRTWVYRPSVWAPVYVAPPLVVATPYAYGAPYGLIYGAPYGAPYSVPYVIPVQPATPAPLGMDTNGLIGPVPVPYVVLPPSGVIAPPFAPVAPIPDAPIPDVSRPDQTNPAPIEAERAVPTQ